MKITFVNGKYQSVSENGDILEWDSNGDYLGRYKFIPKAQDQVQVASLPSHYHAK